MNLFCVIFYSDVAYFPLFFIFLIQICHIAIIANLPQVIISNVVMFLLNGRSNELKFKLQMHNVLWCMVSLLLCICFFMYIIGCLCNVLYDKAYLKTYHVQFSEQVVLMPFNDFLSLILVTSTCKFYLSSTFQGLERFLLHPTSMRTS